MGFLQKFAHHVNPAAGCQSSSQKPGATPQNGAPNGARIEPKPMKNRARAHLGQQLAAKRGPRAPKKRPRRAQEAAKSAQERPKSAQERPKSAQEPPKRRPGDVQTLQKSAPERSRTSFSCAHGRKPCSRSCWADFCSFFPSRARWPTCSDVRFVPLLPVFCRGRSIHATLSQEHAKACKNLEK